MNDWQAKVEQFRRAMGQTVNLTPTRDVSDHDRFLCRALISEEETETWQALKANDLEDIADGLADLLYVVLGAAVCYGIDMGPVFDEVHAANMRKLDGPKDPATGKQLKPVGWVGPDISGVLKAQGGR